MSGVREDCFGYNVAGKCCNALNELYCKTEKCGFYKTREQHKAEQEKYRRKEESRQAYIRLYGADGVKKGE